MLYETLHDQEAQGYALRKAIIECTAFTSERGSHRVDIVDGAAVYSVLGIRQATNDGTVFEIAPADFLGSGNLNMLLSVVVSELVEDPPEIWSSGFGWASGWLNSGRELVSHPFPLQIDLNKHALINTVSPAPYFHTLVAESWIDNRMSFIEKIFERIVKSGYLPPEDVTASILKKTLAKVSYCAKWADARVIALALTACGVSDKMRPKLLKKFRQEISFGGAVAQFPVQPFYDEFKAHKDKLPEGHILFEMADIAESELVKRKLVT